MQGSSEADKIRDFVELTAEPQLLPFAPKRDLQSNPAGLRLIDNYNLICNIYQTFINNLTGILNMLFKSLGVAIATNNASNSDEDLKPITIRLADSEIQLYDTVSKSMGLTRQDFLSHVIRSNFRQALKEFVVGYTSSNPSTPLSLLFNSNTDNDEVRLKLSNLLSSISQELMDEEEKEIHEAIENHMNTSYTYATRPKGIFVEKDDSK